MAARAQMGRGVYRGYGEPHSRKKKGRLRERHVVEELPLALGLPPAGAASALFASERREEVHLAQQSQRAGWPVTGNLQVRCY